MSEPHASLDLFGVVWRLGATLLFVSLNGFFVAAEFALVKVREARIDQLVREGRRAAPAVQHILRHLDRYLSACQLGITLASLILGALGEPAVSVLIRAAASGLGIGLADDAGWVPIVSITLAFLLITMLHMTVGEQAPKMWALRRSENAALATAPILRGFTWVFGPFIVAINWISNALLRLAGLPADLGHEESHSAEEIRSILSLSARSGHITAHEHEIAENVFRMMELEVRHIVVPRVDVVFLTLEHDLESNLERIRTSGHSRFALCRVGLDTIEGVLHAKDILEVMLRGEKPDLAAIARPPLFVPETMSLSGFLRELQASRQHSAIVIDEHGTAVGMAFREDALEEIVGPLGDEFDEDEPRLNALADGSFELPGRTPLPEVESRLGFELSEDDRDEGEHTIGGLVTARLDRFPRKGDTVQVGPYLVRITDVSRRRVQRLRMTPIRADEEGATRERMDRPPGEAKLV